MLALAKLQRKADYWAAKLGVGPVTVGWFDGCPLRTRQATRTGEYRHLDAHCHARWDRGRICVAAHVANWTSLARASKLMRHEVAHLVGNGRHGTKAFMAAAGETPRTRFYIPVRRNGQWRQSRVARELTEDVMTQIRLLSGSTLRA